MEGLISVKSYLQKDRKMVTVFTYQNGHFCICHKIVSLCKVQKAFEVIQSDTTKFLKLLNKIFDRYDKSVYNFSKMMTTF